MAANSAAAQGVAGRYATALFGLASERGALDQVESDLASLSNALREAPDFRRVLRSPIVSREEHGRVLETLAERLGIGDAVRNFLGLLAQHRRLGYLDRAIEAYRATLAQRRGELNAEVVSAVPLGEGELTQLRESVGRYAGRAVNLTTSVDPSLIGGLVVTVGSRMIDASLRTKLQHLEQAMRGAR